MGFFDENVQEMPNNKTLWDSISAYRISHTLENAQNIQKTFSATRNRTYLVETLREMLEEYWSPAKPHFSAFIQMCDNEKLRKKLPSNGNPLPNFSPNISGIFCSISLRRRVP
jgi:hypothetical protein